MVSDTMTTRYTAMKSIVLLSVCVLLCFGTKAVGQELQYSSSIYIELEGTAIGSSGEVVDSYTLIVPEGKTVKLTSASTASVSSMVPVVSLSTRLYLNDKLIHFMGNESVEFMPIWLPQGTFIIKLVGSGANPHRAFVSGVEFNIGQ